MTSSLDMIRGRSNIVTLTNKSGGGLVAGDVCVQDTTNAESVTTTTSAASVLKVYIAAETIANDATGRFYESGYCPFVNVNASVTNGRFLFTHTVAKQAAENATYGAGAFGKILKTSAAPSAIIYSATAQISGAGTIGGGTGSTDNAVIRADGTGGITIQSSLATVDDSGTVNIPTGQTYNINNSPHTHASSASRTLISEQTPTGTGTVTWNSIAGTYKSLELEIVVRTDKAAQQSTSMNLRFNNDTTDGNYRRATMNQSNTTVSGGATDNPDGLIATGDGALANNASYIFVKIMDYAGTAFDKVALIRQSYRGAATTENQNFHSVWWENTAAITRIDIIVDDGSNYVTGSTFRLYGVA